MWSYLANFEQNISLGPFHLFISHLLFAKYKTEKRIADKLCFKFEIEKVSQIFALLFKTKNLNKWQGF